MKHYRFLEKEHITKQLKQSSKHITDADIDALLSPSYIYDDLIITIVETHSSGFKTEIFDNNSESYITMDELSGFSLDFYYKVVKEYSLEQQRKILEIKRSTKARENIRNILVGV
jgi:hypothetical protein